MLRTGFDKSSKQQSTKQQLYSYLPSVSQTIQVWRVRFAGHGCISKNQLMSDVLLWTPTHKHTSAGQPAEIYINQLYTKSREPAWNDGMI